jgi:hypothetical protein
MKYAAIPTKYKGVQFRSRLEARWAAFLDLKEMEWRYEPIDLQGYIPDFLVSYLGEPEILLEVKPVDQHVEFAAACRKIDASGWKGRPLEAGDPCYTDALVVGVDPRFSVERAVTQADSYSAVRFDQNDSPHIWELRLAGVSWNAGDFGYGECLRHEWRDLWNEAGNLTQYKGKAAKRS